MRSRGFLLPMRLVRTFLLVVALSLLIAAAAPFSAAAQGRSGWSIPVEVSDTSATSAYARAAWFPDVAVDPQGGVHVVWYGSIVEEETEIDLLLHRELRNGVWSPVNDVLYAGTGGYTVRNGLVMGRDGMLHAIVRMGVSIKYTRAPWDQAAIASAWSEPRTIADGYYNGIAIDSKGWLHAIWTGGFDENEGGDLFYRRSTDGGLTWERPVNVSDLVDGEDKPQIKVDSFDRVHIFWDHGFDWYVGRGKPQIGLYRRSDDGGATWSEPVTFGLPDDQIQQTTVAATRAGGLLAVYRSATTSNVYFQYSPDGVAWSRPARVPGVVARNLNDPPLDIYSLAVDSVDNVHLLMNGYTPDDLDGPPRLMHLTWNGSVWSSPVVVMQTEHDRPEWPRLLISGGNQLHAVWFTRNELYDPQTNKDVPDRQVWYSTRTLNTPVVTGLPLFTPVPTTPEAPTPTPAAAPTPTPLDPVAAQAPPIDSGPSWELNGLAIVAFALLPTAGVLAAVIGISQWLRRRRA